MQWEVQIQKKQKREQLEIYISQIDLIFRDRTKYHIYVIEQESDRDDYDSLSDEFKQEGTRMAKFNLGRLKNIGFELAEKNFTIFHILC